MHASLPWPGANATSSTWTYELGTSASTFDQTSTELHLVHWWVAVLPSEDKSTFSGLPTSKRTLFRRLRTWGRSLWWWKCHGMGRYIIQQPHANGNLTGQRYRDEILAPVVVPYFNVNRNVNNLSTGQCQMSYSTCLSWSDEQQNLCTDWGTDSQNVASNACVPTMARCKRDVICKNDLQQHNIDLLPWPHVHLTCHP